MAVCLRSRLAIMRAAELATDWQSDIDCGPARATPAGRLRVGAVSRSKELRSPAPDGQVTEPVGDVTGEPPRAVTSSESWTEVNREGMLS